MLRPCPRESRIGSPPKRVVTKNSPPVGDRLSAEGDNKLRTAAGDGDRQNRAFIAFNEMAFVVIDRAMAAAVKSV